MKYYIIAGEASGDLHASNLMKSLKKKDPVAEFRFWGGDLMADVAGIQPVKHYKELAFMGFLEVAKNLKTILKNIKFCKEDIKSHQPDVLILVDYPGFNLRIAAFAKTPTGHNTTARRTSRCPRCAINAGLASPRYAGQHRTGSATPGAYPPL